MILKLGDIIRIIAPRNEEIHTQTYIIDFINEYKLKLINIAAENLTEHVLDIVDGNITDESIEQIEILSRSSEDGYARQHGFIPGVWLDIHFGGEIPIIVTGLITNIEDDMIEITNYSTRQAIYIDFAYEGIPEEIPIVKIVIRDEPTEAPAVAAAVSEYDEYSTPSPEKVSSMGEMEAPSDAAAINYKKEELEPNFKKANKSLYVAADKIVFGSELEEIVEEVEVRKGQERYGLEIQVQDFMDQLLSVIPNHKRTPQLLNDLHNIIERFKQLREEFSIFESMGGIRGNTVSGKKIRGADYKPMISHITELDKKLKWFIPVITDSRRIYNNNEIKSGSGGAGAVDGFVLEEQFNVMKDDLNAMDTVYYKNSTENPFHDKYTEFIQTVAQITEQYKEPTANTDTIAELKVNTKMESIYNTLQDFYSVVFKDNKLSTQKFVTQVSITGDEILKPDESPSGAAAKQYIRNKVTQNERIHIQSFLVLPEPVVRFSAIHTPNTNILQQSNLNLNYFSLWRLLRNNKVVDKKIVDGTAARETDTEEGMAAATAEDDKFLTSVRQYLLNETSAEDIKGAATAENSTSNIVKLLDGIIPKTKFLFQKVQNFIRDKYTFTDVIRYLEPFLIYTDDVSFKQYKIVRKFLFDQIKLKRKLMADNTKLYNSIRTSFNTITAPVLVNTIYDFLSSTNNFEDITREYGLAKTGSENATTKHDIIKKNKFTSSEIVSHLFYLDNGRLFMTILASLNLSLISAEDILKTIEDINMKDVQDLDKLAAKDEKCKTRRISKKYTSRAVMEKDNGRRDVFFDKEYDDTPYDLLDDEKIKAKRDELKSAGGNKFHTFLKKLLMDKHKYSEPNAETVAADLIRGRKLVAEGDFAILALTSADKETADFNYYRRQNNAWVYKKKEDENTFGDNTGACIVDDSCIAGVGDGDCHTIELTANQKRQKLNKKLLDEFSHRANMSVKEVRDRTTEIIKEQQRNIKYLKILNSLNEHRANQLATFYAKTVNLIGQQNIVSPYMKLRDYIFSQTDFIKKQNFILEFKERFCREALVENMAEEPQWLYCNSTNTKLMPVSLYKVADAFINHNEDFKLILAKICAEYGEESEDGDAVVDKYSGYVLRKKDLVIQDEYDENGSKIVSYGELEDSTTVRQRIDAAAAAAAAEASATYEAAAATQQTAAAAAPAKKVPLVFDNENTKDIYKVSNFLAENIGIPYELIEEVVLQYAPKIFEKYIPRKDLYEKTILPKNGVPFDKYRSQLVIYLSAGMTILAIQTLIPSPKIKKTFPQCVRSFSGFPFEGIEDMSSLEYVSCIINKTKSSIPPWDSIKKVSHVAKIKFELERHILKEPAIEMLITKKKEYLASPAAAEEALIAPKKHRIQRWVHFYPPLVPIEVKSITPITPEFKKEFVTIIRQGKKEQRMQLGVLQGKMMKYTAGIIDKINDIVRSRDPLLKTASKIPFMENTCCDESTYSAKYNTLLYFQVAAPEILEYINNTRNIEFTVSDVVSYSTASFIFHPRDTTKKSIEVKADLNRRDIIYDAIIKYCKLDTDFPIPPLLLPICSSKIEGLLRTWSLDEKIEHIEKQGKKFQYKDLLAAIDIVNRENIVDIQFQVTADQRMSDFFHSLMEDESIDAPPLVDETTGRLKMKYPFLEGDGENLKKHLLQYAEIKSRRAGAEAAQAQAPSLVEITGTLRRYLSRTNTAMYSEIARFFRQNQISQKEFSTFGEGFLKILGEWKTDELKFNNLEYYTNNILFMTKIFPRCFINGNINRQIAIHPHWDLSPDHRRLLEKMIKDYDGMHGYSAEKDVVNNLLLHIYGNYEHMDEFLQQVTFLDNTTRVLLYINLWYSIMIDYIHSCEIAVNLHLRNARRDVEMKRRDEEEYIATGGAEIEDIEENETTPSEYANQIRENAIDALNIMEEDEDILGGNVEELRKTVYNLFMRFIRHFYDTKEVVNKTYDEIYERVMRSRNKEKEKIKTLLRDMDPEERKVEQEKMILKMGEWKTGKEIFKYDADYFDKELAREREYMGDGEDGGPIPGDMDEFVDNVGEGGMDPLERLLSENHRSGREAPASAAPSRDMFIGNIYGVPEEGDETEMQEEDYIGGEFLL